MKKSIFLLFILFINSTFLLCQVNQDSVTNNHVYSPINYNSLTPKESWEIHKEAYVKQLKAKGLTNEEIKERLIIYEKQKEEFLARLKEEERIADIQSKKIEEQRLLADIERSKADVLRTEAEIQRRKAEDLRKLADIERKKAGVKRSKADEFRKQAEIQREKAEELRKQAEIQRTKAEEQRKKSQEWRKNAEDILIENITLSKQVNHTKPIQFNVTSKRTLYIGIRAHLKSGNALIELYNPKGIKEGELSLKSKSIKDNQGNIQEPDISGAFDKTIKNAEAGEWQIKILSQKCNGSVAMSVAQSSKPTADE